MVHHALEGLGNQIWMEALRRTQLMDNINIATMQDLGSLMTQTFQSLPFFPFFPYLTANQTLQFILALTLGNVNPNTYALK